MNTKELGVSPGNPDFFAAGKMDVDFEIHEKYVIGICLLYPSRSDQENEYMIREKSVVFTGGQDLSACVQDAKDLAFQSAISRLGGIQTVRLPSPPPAAQPAPALEPVITDRHVDEKPAPKNPGSGEKESEPEVPPPAPEAKKTVPVTHAHTPPEQDEAGEPDEPDNLQGNGGDDEPDTDEPDADEPGATDVAEPVSGKVERFDLGLGLQPASNLLKDAPEAPPAAKPDIDADYQKALNMPITILGKLHLSFGKTAGEILETDPQCIVDFAHRYTGPKVEEKAALVKLYPEAVRRVSQAA